MDELNMDLLRRIQHLQPSAVAYLRRNGFVMDVVGPLAEDAGELDRWKVLAFSLYTDLAEASTLAERILESDDVALPEREAAASAEALRAALELADRLANAVMWRKSGHVVEGHAREYQRFRGEIAALASPEPTQPKWRTTANGNAAGHECLMPSACGVSGFYCANYRAAPATEALRGAHAEGCGCYCHEPADLTEDEPAAPATEALRVLDNLLRHHNTLCRPMAHECEFARQANAALASPEPTPDTER